MYRGIIDYRNAELEDHCLCNDLNTRRKFKATHESTPSEIVCIRCFKKYWYVYSDYFTDKKFLFPIRAYTELEKAISILGLPELGAPSSWTERRYNEICELVCIDEGHRSEFFNFFDAFRYGVLEHKADLGVMNGSFRH